LIVLVAIGYRAPQEDTGVANAATIANPTAPDTTPSSVNSVVAASIAANVATTANLSVAPAVANFAVSTQIESELAQSETSSASKPQIVELSSASRNITSYTVVDGDTIDSIAAKFSITKETVKWANNMSSDKVTVGQNLEILPRDGIVYTVKADDTIQSISDKYKSDASLITTYNDLEISSITPGLKIIVPAGVLPDTERPGYVAPVTRSTGYVSSAASRYGYSSDGFTVVNPSNYISVSIYANRVAAGNKNYNGQCTWYAWERRAAMGRPLPGNILGNASSWAYSLRGTNVVNSTPAVGAVIQNGGGAGHVGVVEAINDDGSLLISEMNNLQAGGAYVVSTRTVPAYAVGYFNYIH